MTRKRYTAEGIIRHLRTIETELGKRLAVVEACRKLGITEQTYYRWKKEYGGLRVDQAERLKGNGDHEVAGALFDLTHRKHIVIESDGTATITALGTEQLEHRR